MRDRMLRGDFFSDERVAALTPYARLAFQGLWCVADEHGRLAYRPEQLRAKIFPYEPDVRLEQRVQEMVTAGLVQRYRVSGAEFLAIPGFAKHQRVDRRQASAFPAPPLNGAKSEHSETTPNAMDGPEEIPHIEKPAEGRVREGKGKEGKGESNPPESPGDGLTPLQLSHAMLELIGLPRVRANLDAGAAAIEAVMYSQGMSDGQAMDWLVRKAQEAKARGQPVNRWFFEDGKYSQEASSGSSKADQEDKLIQRVASGLDR